MGQSLAQRFVRIFEFDIFTNDRDLDVTARRILDRRNQFPPALEIDRWEHLLHVKIVYDQFVQCLFMKRKRHLIDRRHVECRDHGIFLHVTKKADLLSKVGRQRAVRSAQQDIRRYSDLTELPNTVLSRLGFQFAGRSYKWYECYMDEDRVIAALFVAHLPDRFHKRQRFDIADRAADLNDQDVRLVHIRDRSNRRLDLIGNVRDDLDRFAKVFAAALFIND